MQRKSKKINFIFIIYWFLLTYIIAALVWWFIALNQQNEQTALFKLQQINLAQPQYSNEAEKIQQAKKRKTTQYLGEGATFFLLIMAGAAFVFRAVRRQLKYNQQQQNFMIALTHELKTPIAVAQLNLETLQKRKLDEAQQQHLIQTTLQETNRLNNLCNNMLLSSQIESKNFKIGNEAIDCSQLVSNSVNDYKTRFPQRNFIAAIQPNVFITGDNLLLQMAINNLIDNAIKYSPKETVINILFNQVNKQIIFQVKDQGKGISKAETKKVFNKFYRVGNAATKEAKGTGLGLYLAKKITEEHKGNISFANNLPTGSIFTIILPIS